MAFSGAFVKPFRPAFDAGLAAAGNGLLNNLVAYWPGNEASGNLQDAHTNALHLTDTNTVTSAAGKVYATARQYTAANSEYHTRPGDDALLSVADIDFTLATWVYFDTVGTVSKWIVAKRTNPATGGYQLVYSASDIGGSNLLRFSTSSGGVNIGTVAASSHGTPTAGQWLFIVCSHDSVADTVNIQVNNGTVNSAATTGVPADDAGKFIIGALIDIPPSFYMNGRIGPVAMWKSSAGGGGVLDATKRSLLYNGGAGLTYAAFTT